MLLTTQIHTICESLFGKFFYNDSLFSMSCYKNKVGQISFQWEHVPPFFCSIVKTPLQKEIMILSADKKIVSYKKYTKLY